MKLPAACMGFCIGLGSTLEEEGYKEIQKTFAHTPLKINSSAKRRLQLELKNSRMGRRAPKLGRRLRASIRPALKPWPWNSASTQQLLNVLLSGCQCVCDKIIVTRLRFSSSSLVETFRERLTGLFFGCGGAAGNTRDDVD